MSLNVQNSKLPVQDTDYLGPHGAMGRLQSLGTHLFELGYSFYTYGYERLENYVFEV